MEQKKQPNDIFIASLNAPEAETLDLMMNGITASNTSKYDREVYKNSKFIQDKFSKDGVFDDAAFEAAYQRASEKYNNLVEAESFQNLNQFLEYDKYGRYTPIDAKIRDVTPTVQRIRHNPLQQAIGYEGFNNISKPILTSAEAAQSGKIWDSENKSWLDTSAEDLPLYKKLLGQTLVYATYDSTGVQKNPITGEEAFHQEGEFITDENGQYFTETLGARQIGKKRVVAAGDILTKEGTWQNKLDFWDSDGYDKSLGGIALKTFFTILPYLTPIRGYYGGIVAILGLIETAPILYKSIESILSHDSANGLSSNATRMENWFKKFEPSMSDTGRDGFWNVENLGNLVADTFGQLHQQVAAGSLAPKVLARLNTTTGKVAKYQQLMNAGKIKEAQALAKEANLTAQQINEGLHTIGGLTASFALAYMGLEESSRSFNDAINAGYDKTTAGITALATMAALFGIMKFNAGKNGLGTWFLEKATGYSEHASKAGLWKLAKEELTTMQEGIRKAIQQKDTEAFKYTLREWKRNGASKLHDAFVVNAEDYWKGFLVEGVEESTEEAVQDMVKGVIDTLASFGYVARTTDAGFGGWNNVFSKEGIERYVATFVGGGIGGSVFALQRNKIDPWVDKLWGSNYQSTQEQKDNENIVRLYLNGHFDEYIETLKKGKSFLNNSLDVNYIEKADGTREYISTNSDMSQADLAVKAAIDKAYLIKEVLDSVAGKDYGNLDMFERELRIQGLTNIINEFGFEKDYLREQYTKAAAAVVQAQQEVDSFKTIENLNDQQKEQQKLAKKQLDAAILNFKGFFNSDQWGHYLAQLGILADEVLGDGRMSKSLNSMTIEDFAANTYRITDINQLSDSEKADLQAKFNLYKSQTITKENMSEVLPILEKLLDNLLVKNSKAFQDGINLEQQKKITQWMSEVNHENSLYKQEMMAIDQEELDYRNAQFENPDTPEDQQKAIEQFAKRRQELENFIRFNLDNLRLARLNPRMYSTRSLSNFDLYKVLAPYLELVNFDPESEKVLEQMINDYARNSDVLLWTEQHIRSMIDYLNNNILSNDSNLYKRKINEIAKAKNEGVIPTGMSISLKEGLDTATLDKIRKSRLNFLKDFTKVDGPIDQNLKNQLLEIQLEEIISKFKELGLDDFADESSKNLYNDVLNYELSSSERTLKLQSLTKLLQQSVLNDLQDAWNGEKDIETFEQIEPEDYNHQFVDPGSTAKAYQQIEQALKDLDETFTKETVEHPIVTALQDIYVGIHHSTNGGNIFKDLFERSNQFKTLDGLQRQFSEEERKSIIDDIFHTLNIARDVIHSMGPSGLSRILSQYADVTNSINKGKYKVLSTEEVLLAEDIIDDIFEQYNRLLNLSAAIGATKAREDIIARQNYNIGLAKTLEEGIPIPTNLFSIGEIPDKEKFDLEDSIQAEQYVSLVFKKVYQSAQTYLKNNGDPTELIKGILNEVGDDIYGKYEKAYNLFTWDSANKQVYSNKLHLAHLLIRYCFIDPEIIVKDKEGIFNNDNIFPKFDQELAIDDILAFARSMTYKIKDTQYHFISIENQELYTLTKKVSNKDLTEAPTSIVLFGGPGSGKSFVSDIIKTKLEEILTNGDTKNQRQLQFVSATQDRVDQYNKEHGLTKDSPNSGLTVQQVLDKLGIWNIVSTVEETCKDIVSEWGNADYTKPEDFIQKYKESIQYNDETGVAIIDLDKYNDARNKDKGYTKVGTTIELQLMGKDVAGKLFKTQSAPKIITFGKELVDFNTLSLGDLIVDEVTLLSPAVIFVLSSLGASKNNNSLIFYNGDFNQSSYVYQAGNVRIDGSITEILNLDSTPILNASFRFSSNLQSENIIAIATALDDYLQQFGEHEGKNYGLRNISANIAPSQTQHLKETLKSYSLQWQFLTSGEFIGTKINPKSTDYNLADIKQNPDFINIINDVQKNNRELLFIVDTIEQISVIEKSDLIEGLPNVKVKSKSQVQGGEWDYVIAINLTDGYESDKQRKQAWDTDVNARLAFTVLSRSKLGTLVFDNSINGLFTTSGINSSPYPSYTGFLYKNEDHKEAMDGRRNQLKALIQLMQSLQPEKPDEPEDPKIITQQAKKEGIDGTGNYEKLESDTDNEEDENKNQASELQKFENASILGTWYNRLGYNWRRSVEHNGVKTYINDDRADRPTSLEDIGTREEDQDVMGWINAGMFDTQDPTTGGFKTYFAINQAFLEFKRKKVAEICMNQQELKSSHFRAIVVDYNQDIDYPYAKYNFLEEKQADKQILIQVKVTKDDKSCWVTLGRLGYNKDSDENTVSKTQKLIFNQKQYYFKFKDNEALDKLIKDYYASRPNTLNLPQMFVRYTNLRDKQIDDSDYNRRTALESTTQLRYQRLMLKEYLKKHGYTIVATWDPLGEQINKTTKDFQEWFKKYQDFEKKGITNLDRPETRLWAVLKENGSDLQMPVLINFVSTGSNFEFAKTPKGYAKYYSFNQIARALKYCIDQFFKNTNPLDNNAEIKLPEGTESFKPNDSNDLFTDISFYLDTHGGVSDIIASALGINGSFSQDLQQLKDAWEKMNEPGQKGFITNENFQNNGIVKGLIAKLPGFFFGTQVNSTEIKDLIDNDSVVISRFFESPNFYLLWDQTEEEDIEVDSAISEDEAIKEILKKVSQATNGQKDISADIRDRLKAINFSAVEALKAFGQENGSNLLEEFVSPTMDILIKSFDKNTPQEEIQNAIATLETIENPSDEVQNKLNFLRSLVKSNNLQDSVPKLIQDLLDDPNSFTAQAYQMIQDKKPLHEILDLVSKDKFYEELLEISKLNYESRMYWHKLVFGKDENIVMLSDDLFGDIIMSWNSSLDSEIQETFKGKEDNDSIQNALEIIKNIEQNCE